MEGKESRGQVIGKSIKTKRDEKGGVRFSSQTYATQPKRPSEAGRKASMSREAPTERRSAGCLG